MNQEITHAADEDHGRTAHKISTGMTLSSRCPRQFNARPLPLVPEKRLMELLILSMGQRVIEYRAYFVGSDGHFVKFVGLSCSNDAEAIEQARRLSDRDVIELWSGGRFIVRLVPKENPPG
jgi:hypothetical protein